MNPNGTTDPVRRLVEDFEASNPYAAAVRRISELHDHVGGLPAPEILRANAILALAFETYKRSRR